MERELFSYLRRWQKKTLHMPILLRGARQVGKTFLVEKFGKTCFENMVAINFELEPEYLSCFETLKPSEILTKVQVVGQEKITPGSTLFFLDEIQACPNAIMALRYFKEKMPELHVIGAGSLLEFALSEKGMKMPVGRVQYLYLKPLSFREYLKVSGNDQLIEFLSSVTIESAVPEAIHQQALKLVREYMVVGGMPSAVKSYLNDPSSLDCQEMQTALLRTYSDDFGKYAPTSQHKYLKKVYDRTPGLVGNQIKFVNISPDMDSRYLKKSIAGLAKAGVIFPVNATSASGLPLLTHVNEKYFKLLFLDVGLLKRATKLDVDLLLNEDLLLLNRGAIAEQFVGQELLAYQEPNDEPQLYYWTRSAKNSTAEVDYVININSKIVPIEVKAGKTGSLRSLQLLIKEKKLPLGVRISARELNLHGNILSIPFYLIDQLPRLIAYLDK